MNKNLFCAACLLFTAGSASAQKITRDQVPAPVLSSFEKSHPGKSASWESEKGNFEAGLMLDNKSVSLLYSADGQLLETETAMKTSALPAPVLAYVRKHFPGQQLKEAAKIVKKDGSFTYEAAMKGKDLLFSADGEYLRTEED